MSRCKNCTYSFDEENGWQEFCSEDCAKLYFTRGKKGAALLRAIADFDKWLADPKNARTVRMDGTPAEPPKIGKFVDRTYAYTEFIGRGKNIREVTRKVRRRENIGSEIVIRPITDEERAIARSWRGRGSFGENHQHHVAEDIPSLNNKVGQAWFPHDE